MLAPRPSPLAPRAFTFIEVLFAILIMGVGAIMIAGMLPVAIKQSSDTRNAITGQAACEAGYAYVRAISASGAKVLPDSATVQGTGFAGVPSPGAIVKLSCDAFTAANVGTAAAPGPLYALNQTSLTGSRIIQSDPRTQWVAFYGRVTGEATAKLIVLSLHLQNVERQKSYRLINDDPTSANYGTAANETNWLTNGFNDPLLMTADVANGSTPLDPDTIAFPSGNTAQSIDALGVGAYVIVANSPATAADPNRPYRNNGRVFRLGNRRTDLDSSRNGVTYELAPGFDLPPLNYGPDGIEGTADDTATTALDQSMTGAANQPQVWVVGRGLLDTTRVWNTSTNPYVGPVQDVGCVRATIPMSD